MILSPQTPPPRSGEEIFLMSRWGKDQHIHAEGTSLNWDFRIKSGWWIGWFLFVVFQDVRGVSRTGAKMGKWRRTR